MHLEPVQPPVDGLDEPAPPGKSGTVFLGAQGRLRKASVEIGRRTGERIEVTGGLSAGQSIAADGLEKLSDGQRMRS